MIKKDKLSRLICFALALIILLGSDLIFIQDTTMASSFPDSFELTIDRQKTIDHKILKNPRAGSDFYETIGAIRNFIAYYKSTSGMVFYCSERGVHIKEYDYIKSGGEYKLDDDLAGVLSAWAYLEGWKSYDDFLKSYQKKNDYVLSTQLFMWLTSGQVEIVDTNSWIYKFWNAYKEEKSKMSNDLVYDFSNIKVGRNVIKNTGKGGYFSKHLESIPIKTLSDIKISDKSVSINIDNKGDIILDVPRQALEKGFTISLSQPRIDNHKLIAVDYVNKLPKYQRLKAIGGNFASSKNYEFKVSPKLTQVRLIKKAKNNLHLVDLAKNSYSLYGAVYNLYISRQDAENNLNPIETFTIKDDGKSESKALLEGKYFIKEVKPPQNYKLSNEIIEIDLNGSSQEINLFDEPLLPNPQYIVNKYDKKSSIALDKTLFEISYFDGYPQESLVKDQKNQDLALRKWIFETDADGKVKYQEAYKKSGDDLFKDDSGKETLLMGTYTIKEVKAKPGYVLDDKVHVLRIVQNSKNYNSFDFDLIDIANQAQQGQISLTKIASKPFRLASQDKLGHKVTKIELEEQALGNSKWHIISNEDIFTADGQLAYKKDELVDEIISSNQESVLSKKIPLGRYRLEEVHAPKEYVIDGRAYEVNLVAPNQIEQVIVEKVTNKNIRKKASIEFSKQFEKSKYFSNPSKALIGLFLAKDYNENNLFIKKDTLLDIVQLEQDKNLNSLVQGKFENIPIDGHFYIQEIQSSDQYQLNSKKYPVSFDFSNSNNQFHFIKLNETIDNKLKRVSLEINKKELGSEGAISVEGAEYKLFSLDHVLGERLIGTYYTDLNGSIKINDLQIGSYILRETKPAFGYLINLNEEVIDLSKLNHNEKFIHTTYDEKIVNLKTRAESGEGKKNLNPIKQVKIIDKVDLEGLIVGEKYTLYASQIIKETGQVLVNSDARPVEKRIEFTADARNMTMEVEFNIDLDQLRGKSLVTFEELYRKDYLLGSHKNINDLGQTVKVEDPEIKTSFSTINEQKEILGNYLVSLVDKVSYEGLVEGDKYTLELLVMDKSTKLPLIIDGKEVRASHEFIADKDKGVEEVKIANIDLSLAKGKDLVAYEKLFYKGQEIAKHEDLEDKNQTIKVVEVKMPFTGSNKIIKNSVSASILFLIAGYLIYKNKNNYKERIRDANKK